MLRWFRVLVAKKWTFAKTNPVGRPPGDPELEKLVIKLITENPTWGSNRIVGALDNLGFKVSDSTVDNIRRRNGFDPASVFFDRLHVRAVSDAAGGEGLLLRFYPLTLLIFARRFGFPLRFSGLDRFHVLILDFAQSRCKSD